MRMFVEKPKGNPQTTPANFTIRSRAHPSPIRDVNFILPLQHTIGNQAGQRTLQSNAGELQVASNSLASTRFGHDFSRILVHASQVRADAASKEPAAPHHRDMEGPIAEGETMDTDQEIGADATPQNAVSQQVAPPLGPTLAPGPTVTLPPHIRGSSSPAGMPDRIPPRADTPAAVTIAGLTIPMRDITLSIDGAGGGNGTVTINGAATVDLGTSATVQLRGVNQTAPGKAGNLTLVASHGGRRLATSAGFSVSSIPQNFSVTFNSQISTPTMRGLAVNNHWESDSGNVADLDEAERSEQVEYGAATGIWAGVVGGNNSGYLPANSPPLVDSHGTPLARLTGPGSRIAEQVFTFNDKRTGATDIAATKAGFRLTRTAVTNAAGKIEFTVDKRGAATTATGFSSAAGSGTVTRTQVI
jgi:hypothetical protein